MSLQNAIVLVMVIILKLKSKLETLIHIDHYFGHQLANIRSHHKTVSDFSMRIASWNTSHILLQLITI